MGNPLSDITSLELVYLTKLFGLQQKADNAVSIDFLPYTSQIKWIAEEMAKKFSKRGWTEKMIHRCLLRMRKASLLEKGEKKDTVPVFAADDDCYENATLRTTEDQGEPIIDPIRQQDDEQQ